MIVKKIGIDEDGVKTPYYDYMMERAVSFCQKHFDKEVVNPNGYDIKEIFDINGTQKNIFWWKYIWGLFLCQPASSEDIEILEKWLDEGRELDIITARAFVKVAWYHPAGPIARSLYYIRQKLDGSPIKKENIIFCSEKDSAVDKPYHINNRGTQIMLEDKVDNIEAIIEKTNCNVIMPIWPYNQSYDNERIIRVPKDSILLSSDKIITEIDSGTPFSEVKKIERYLGR